GYRPEAGAAAGDRVSSLLGMLTARLERQREKGSAYLIGDAVTAVDVYLATFMALFSPLGPDLCPLPDAFRAAFETLDDQTRKALDPLLLAHRDHVYEHHLELPIVL
ncbi:MAG: hypothetical protein AAF354_08515, partial [Pseudomonadota bacterium]